MLNLRDVRSAADRLIAQASQPVKVILFGSYASGNADEGSDLDLLVIQPVLPDPSYKAAEYLRLKKAVGRVGVGVDLILISQHDFDRRSQVPGTLPYWAKQEGKLLHDTPG